jgi:hypothetical protein
LSGSGKVKVVVRSRRVPVRTVEFATHPILPVGTYSTPIGNMSNSGLRRERIVVYESVLDEDQRRAVDEGQRLACNLGLEMEVIDESKLGIFRRMWTSLGRNGSWKPEVVVSITSAEPNFDVAQPLVDRK